MDPSGPSEPTPVSGAPEVATSPPPHIRVEIKRYTPALIVLVFIAGFFMLVSGFLFVMLVAVSVSKAAPDLAKPKKPFIEKTVLGDKSAADKILLIPIEGVITNVREQKLFDEEMGLVDRVEKMLKQAKDDPKIRALLLYINSPGGSITSSDVLYHDLVKYRRDANGKVKIVSLLGDVAASGGYYVASASDRIIAHPTTLTGSIGVIMPLMSAKELMNKIGVKPQPIKSTPMKDIGAFYSELTENERQVLQKIVDELYHRFINVVKDGAENRGVRRKIQGKIMSLADGRVFTGEQAVPLGLVDELGYFRDGVAAAEKLAGVSNAHVVRYELRAKGLLELLQSTPASGATREIRVRVEGFPWPSSNLPMYLWCPGAPALLRSGPNP